MNDEPADQVVLFSEGEYQLREDSSLACMKSGDANQITIRRTKKYA